MHMESEPNSNIYPSLSQEFKGQFIPSDLEDIINEAATCNKYGFATYGGDEVDDIRDVVAVACEPLNMALLKKGYKGTKAYVMHTTGMQDVEEDCRIVGFSPLRQESQFEGGMIKEAEGWEIGLKISVREPDHIKADDTGYVSKIISINNGLNDVEMLRDRFLRLCDKTAASIIRSNPKFNAIGHYNFLNSYLKDAVYKYQKVRNIGKYARRIVNNKACRDNIEVQQNVGSMILCAYGTDRYEFYQDLVTEAKFDAETMSLQQGRISKHLGEKVDGRLKSVVMLPRIESRRQVLIPNFIVQPNGDPDRLLSLPLEKNNFMSWLSK